MKLRKRLILFMLCVGLLFTSTSCVVSAKNNSLNHDNGKHKGWYKNTHNPHNPNTTNPGKAKGKVHK